MDQEIVMAHFHILEEARTGDTGGWQLCFQYGIYEYDPSSDRDASMEFGYRFIWRRPNGQLQGARGQARLEPELMAILFGSAAVQGWYPTFPHTRGRTFRFNETVWRVSIHVSSAFGARAEGDYFLEQTRSGLSFRCHTSHLFLPMDYPELPTKFHLALAPQEQLVAWLRRAQQPEQH